METMETKEIYKAAWAAGKKFRESGYTSWMPAYFTPALQAAADLGTEGIAVDFDNLVHGYRYGEAPGSCRSYNYRDGYKEAGISMAHVDGYARDVEWYDDGSRKRVEMSGYLINAKGSDGEALILPAEFEIFD